MGQKLLNKGWTLNVKSCLPMKVAYDVTMEVNKLGDDIKKVPYEVTM